MVKIIKESNSIKSIPNIYTNVVKDAEYTYDEYIEDNDFPILDESVIKFLDANPSDIFSVSNQDDYDDGIDGEFVQFIHDNTTKKVNLDKEEYAADFMWGCITPYGKFVYETEEGGLYAVWFVKDNLIFNSKGDN